MSSHTKIIIAVLGLVVLCVCTIAFRRKPIEQDLTNKVTSSLSNAEFKGIDVKFKGRDGNTFINISVA